MGLLKVGKPLSWNDMLPHCRYIRDHGVKQFLSTWNRVKDIENDRLFYGDEIEYSILLVDHDKREVRLHLRGAEVMQHLNDKEQHTDHRNGYGGCTWHQEYGSWMLESTPAMPFGGYTKSLLQVEESMRLRRARLLSALRSNEIAPTLVSFPLMGVGDFVRPAAPPGGPASLSTQVPDSCINPHPRFATLTANIRNRRGSKVDIRVPIFKDEHTREDDIEMDCMAYGMGCCCLQVTFQCSDAAESRYLHDQLATLAPIMLALTGATPILHGRLANTDVRWHVISAAVDDRTPVERGVPGAPVKRNPDMAGEGVRPLAKSRYDSISAYISQRAHLSKETSEYFNDVPCEIDRSTLDMLTREGIDEPLARHLAHLFVRDPLVAFEGSIQEVDDSTSVEHFESLNSTNWQTMRWKPPPPKKDCGPHIGWRTEFRSMEVQLTDFENAAFTAFVVLLTRVLLVFDLDFLLPLSKVDDNMSRAHTIDAVNKERFWFRSEVVPGDTCQFSPRPSKTANDEFEELTMAEIVNGRGSFPGLVPLCYAYLDHIQCDAVSFARIDQYLTFIKRRALGELVTPATFIRDFVQKHPEYKKDSIITQGIAYDLVLACDEIGRGVRPCPEVLGDVIIERITRDSAYDTHLHSSTCQMAIAKLLNQLRKRAGDEDGPGSLPTAPLRKRARSAARSPTV
mmetsp:Transcript_103204/g.298575  ORF Transcript_103204/g.298575 Transcript_103204/m.298575 type:complete len:682 (+) Transcript_103204:45-2090(+)